MKGYITCDILGPGDGTENFGLCNQMFQVASLVSHAHDNDLIVTFPQLKTPRFGNYHQNIFSKVNTEDIDFSNFNYLQIPFGYHELPKESNIVYRGYMQSEKYFIHNRKLILDLLSPTNEINEYLIGKYKFISDKNMLSIHIRRGDYVKLQNHHPLVSLEYYSEAINYVVNNTNIDGYVFFSDDIEWCKQTFGDSEDNYYISEEKDYIDLYLMSMCKHNIMANSTFSWWGSWLNQNENKIVVAPKNWFGPARTDLNTNDLIPENWIKL